MALEYDDTVEVRTSYDLPEESEFAGLVSIRENKTPTFITLRASDGTKSVYELVT